MSLFTEKSEELLSRGQLTVMVWYRGRLNGGVAMYSAAVGAIIPFCFKIVDNEILVIIYKVGAMYICTSLKFILGYVLSHKRRYKRKLVKATHFLQTELQRTILLDIYRHVITE